MHPDHGMITPPWPLVIWVPIPLGQLIASTAAFRSPLPSFKSGHRQQDSTAEVLPKPVVFKGNDDGTHTPIHTHIFWCIPLSGNRFFSSNSTCCAHAVPTCAVYMLAHTPQMRLPACVLIDAPLLQALAVDRGAFLDGKRGVDLGYGKQD
eukprot:CAMPEP_0174373050 /NCGR_PEP_ID=MMETSP0811_2-20130205/105635_1 /TAXON_ID=73025 ORGANISM="Eutreptiella gymnastica-like, Strain CCMP1594" /NCGR_SAMPLE_ID=MMETSP0811_2 /ASSEMBLY_ACC=CAM_ASM_000667 /LENGTH=149 /DNA_ID=CAMNT_0015520999 /DNA_START=196 /DNA_END=645 /DNA_ORIENTATION=-